MEAIVSFLPIFLSTIPWLQAHHQLKVYPTLELDWELRIFHKCSVHLVNTAIYKESIYNVAEVSFPLFRSTHYYIRQENEDFYSAALQCNRGQYKPLPNQTSPSQIYHPPPRLTCQVQVFIFPPSCSNWYIEPTTPWSDVVPKSYFDLYNDRFSNETNEISRIERFFVLVSEPQPLKLLNSIFYAVDVDLKSEYEMPLPQIQFKTKIHFEIEPVSGRDRDTYQIRSRYMVSRPNHIERYQCILHEYSADLIRSLGDLEKLEQFQKLSQWDLDCLDCEEYAGKKSIEFTIFKILAPNSTIIKDPISNPFSLFEPQFPNPILIIKEASQKQQLLKFQQGYHFVTCAQPYVDKTWKFIILLQAFDHATWFIILISCIVSGIVVLLILRYKKDKYALLNPTATITFAFNLLLDHHSLVMNKCKWIGGPWLLIVIVLIGGYEGLTIGRITSPDPLRKFDDFQQLVQKRFKIYSQNMFPFSVVQKMPSFLRNYFFKILAESGPNECYVSSFDTYFKQNSISRNPSLIEQIDKLIVRPEGLGEAIKMGRQYYLVYLLKQCQNTALIGDFASVSDMYLALKEKLMYSDAKIGLSFSNSFETVSKSWLFYYVPWSVNTYIRKVNSLAQSGLADLCVNLKREKSARQIRFTELDGVKPLARNGKILIVFYLHGILVLITLVCFLVEIRKKVWAEGKWVCRTFAKFLKRLRRECKCKKRLLNILVTFLCTIMMMNKNAYTQ
ncbi:unnamed protein product [Orchesella dallaii]|uniref:Uncharacterized protein n=1 Tax=Orchesella dallaii TaxID=48710 RepID=A0ABP1S9S9_9HEXA